MLILHTSDWHLGRTIHSADLTPAFELWCRHVINLVDERGIDAVLISGDVYDRGVPSTSSVELFNRTLEELAERTTVILTSGNHDSAQRLGFASGLLRSNVHIRTDSRLSGTPVEVRDSHGNLGALVYPIPYLDPDVERRRLAPHEPPHDEAEPGPSRENDEPQPAYLDRSHEAVLRAALELVAADIHSGPYASSDVARICMAHAFITGAQPSDSERDLHIGGVDSAPSGLFRLGDTTGTGPLSYVALGHLHSPQSVGLDSDPSIRYSGSPIAFSFSETRPKSSVLLHIAGSTVETEIIPAPIWRPIVTLEGPLTVLLEQAEKYRDSFVRCIVTDPSRPAELSARLRHAFPHALEIQHHPEGSLPVSTHPATRITPRLNPLDVVTTFMEQSGGTPLTPVEKHQLRDAWEATRKAEA